LAAKIIVPVEFVVRSSSEGSITKKAEKGESICGQELPQLRLGQLLDRPYFTPTTKAPKGQKDRPITLEAYYKLLRSEPAIANYLYGMSVILHLANRQAAQKNGLDRPDQKMEFGIFAEGLPYHVGEEKNPILNWGKVPAARIFNSLCSACGFPRNAWEKLPQFDFRLFREYAQHNAEARVVRLVDEYGGTDDGRYRRMADTLQGRSFIIAGEINLGQLFLEEYLCKEYFRLASKRTGLGGYEADATQKVIIPDSVLTETGRRNLLAHAMLMSGN
jgi:phosphoribosylaminoimidazole-succinocarboxamide synthase